MDRGGGERRYRPLFSFLSFLPSSLSPPTPPCPFGSSCREWLDGWKEGRKVKGQEEGSRGGPEKVGWGGMDGGRGIIEGNPLFPTSFLSGCLLKVCCPFDTLCTCARNGICLPACLPVCQSQLSVHILVMHEICCGRFCSFFLCVPSVMAGDSLSLLCVGTLPPSFVYASSSNGRRLRILF